MNADATEVNSLGPVFAHINRELAMLHLTWRTYRQLFATSEARFNLLKDFVPGFGWLLHQTLIDSVILGICRLSDTGRQPVTIKRLVGSLKVKLTPEQLKLLGDQQDKIVAGAKMLKEHRDKRIAHSDPQHALNVAAVLPGLSRQTIEDVLKALRDLMNEVSGWLRKTEIDYSVISAGDADSLIWCLQQASRLRELQDDYHLNRLPHDELLAKLAERNLGQM